MAENEVVVLGNVTFPEGVSYSTHLININKEGQVIARLKTREMIERAKKTRAESSKKKREKDKAKIEKEAERQRNAQLRAERKKSVIEYKKKMAELTKQKEFLRAQFKK